MTVCRTDTANAPRRPGLCQTAWRGVRRRSSNWLPFQVHQVLLLERADLARCLERPSDDDIELRWVTARDIASLTDRARLELGGEFVCRLAAGHDLCMGAWCDDRLIAYCWLALGSIEAQHAVGVALSYPADTAYMYKALTLPEFRGRRLYRRVVLAALGGLAKLEITRLVTIVDWNNLDSLRGCQEIGFQKLGSMIRLGRGPQAWRHIPVAARAAGICFGPQADLSVRHALSSGWPTQIGISDPSAPEAEEQLIG